MHCPRLTTLVLASALLSTSTQAAGPRGTWSCAIGGGNAATLLIVAPDYSSRTGVVFDWSGPRPGTATTGTGVYSLIRAGAKTATPGSYVFDANVLTVSSGPLIDDFGLATGFLNDAESLTRLTFSSRQGRGLECVIAATGYFYIPGGLPASPAAGLDEL